MAASVNETNAGERRDLAFLIEQQIVNHPQQRITFADFMEVALYHPKLGYYFTKAKTIGRAGDFLTAPHLAADFGEMIATQFAQMWEILGQPKPFTIIEMGAGQGLLASQILNFLHTHHTDLWDCLEYKIVERSETLIAVQQETLQPLIERGGSIQWCDVRSLAPDSITGCFFSNELVDAFSVHRVRVTNQELQEVYVTAAPPNGEPVSFEELVDELSTPALKDYFSLIGLDLCSSAYPEGYTTEVNLAALDWMQQVARCLHQGFVLTIDYGYPADRYYIPSRTEGTLQCYYQHQFHSNPYIYIGEQDITAHVDFTALQTQGEQYGLQVLGLVPQALFLMSLGLGDRITALGQSESRDRQEIQSLLRRREALHSLVNPMGMGNFLVLLQGKNLPGDMPTLQGLNQPPLF
ncbi:MAG TPA: class I SAM-dependent methyltransferase [Leptolyngbyaceae cyanobacterium M33_DOE_097]|uniref:Class I SAM-dependent methyltransferase n=1 Tax=Oscillatoriales cyanobacterium SpSt-418 TaxID=2282169 RepID=A0A7C3PG63_9CYAN|nr:class I SAM-dependent methyltransferase [Leptolyngbyaceae cyanobacterium M33_DOE_097]